MPDPLLFTSPKLEIQAAADRAKPAKISAPAYSGGVMTIGGTKYVIDLAGLTVPSTVPLLCDHENQIGAIAGSVRPTKRDGRLDVEGNLARGTPAADQVIALAAAGVELAVSVGVEPEEKDYIAPGQTVEANGRTFTADDDGLVLVPKSNLKEISLVPVGADTLATATIAASANRKGGQAMPTTHPSFDEYLQANGFDPVTTTTDMQLALRASYDAKYGTGVDAERILAVADSFPPDIVGSDRGRALRAAATKGQINAAGFEAGLVRIERDFAKADLLVAERPKGPAIHSSARDVGGPQVIQAAFLKHLGHEALAEKTLGPEVLQAGADLRATSFIDIIKASLHSEGREVPSNRNELIKAGFSTHTLTTMLSTTGNKLLEQSYQAVPSVARQIARKLNTNDFKTHTGYRMTGDSTLTLLPPAGEITHGTLDQASFSFRVDTYARMFALTRADMVDDDLGAFDSMPQIIGRGAALRVEQTFWTLVLANTANFFHADNSNYTSGATTVLAIEGLRQAVQTLRQQVDQQDEPVLVEPKFLVVPPELEATADQLYASTNVLIGTSTTEMLPDSNPYKGKYLPLVVPYLSNSSYAGYSTTGWYLFGSPGDVAAFGIAYLSGQEFPIIESSDANFSTLGVQFRGYLDFGVCQVDHRGGVMSKGSA